MSFSHDRLVAAATELCVANQSTDSSGHSHFHSLRVYANALAIQQEAGGDRTVIAVAALLHDVNDQKRLSKGAEPVDLSRFLLQHGGNDQLAARVLEVIAAIDFRGALVKVTAPDIETAVVMDADRLDAIGAIGIARVFAYGGSAGREIYDPAVAPLLHETEASYRANTSSSINHFHEKLLLLKDLMNTEPGRRIAAGRHEFMEAFLARFHDEWQGKA